MIKKEQEKNSPKKSQLSSQKQRQFLEYTLAGELTLRELGVVVENTGKKSGY